MDPSSGGAPLARKDSCSFVKIRGPNLFAPAREDLACEKFAGTGFTPDPVKIPLTLKNFPDGEWQTGRPLKLSVLLYDRDTPNPRTPTTPSAGPSAPKARTSKTPPAGRRCCRRNEGSRFMFSIASGYLRYASILNSLL